MSDVAIRAEGLSKKYVIGHAAMREASTFRDTLVRSAGTFARKAGDLFHGRQIVQGDELEDVWALRDVSFEIGRGEVVGIIGRNGAGKSTLLKILSRIIEPTAGRVHIAGRVASLLEVGTGFHPELTGRENIFLNGAILGMNRAEIKRKFDEIVAFAEVERFLDTPVKRYSSGMYVRLAFAVAAHLEPEILIVDEVLAVGDAEFQKKCIGRMQDVAQHGRTVLFVSHNMLAVQRLCQRCLLLQNGRAVAQGPVADILEQYLFKEDTHTFTGAISDERPSVIAADIQTPALITTAALELMVEWNLPADYPGIRVGIGINPPDGQRIFDSAPEDTGLKSPDSKGRHKAYFTVPPHTLMARHYTVSIGLWDASTLYDHQNPALSFSVEAAPTGPYSHEASRAGLVNVPCQWRF
jgi:lipopolysaccharide transport system ATP-binding protein